MRRREIGEVKRRVDEGEVKGGGRNRNKRCGGINKRYGEKIGGEESEGLEER